MILQLGMRKWWWRPEAEAYLFAIFRQPTQTRSVKGEIHSVEIVSAANSVKALIQLYQNSFSVPIVVSVVLMVVQWRVKAKDRGSPNSWWIPGGRVSFG